MFKIVAGNKEHIVIGQKLNGDFIKFSGLLKKHKLYNDPVPNASQEERAVALEETRKVLKDELPISIKASVKELMDPSPNADVQILIEKEANEEPRLI